MGLMVMLALFGWYGVTLFAFTRLPPARALLAVVVAGSLFLPEVKMFQTTAEAPLALNIGFFSLTKANVIATAALLGVLCFDGRRLAAFRPRWFDIPMALWCLAPMLADIGIGEPINVAWGQMRDQTLMWGVCYLLGRVYLGEAENLRDAAVAVMLGALVYVPLCWFEVLKQPDLHWRFYGYHPNDPAQTMRLGGNRPVVFLDHGLAVGLWVASGAMMATWLWWTGAVRQLPWLPHKPPLPMLWVVALLLVTAVVVKSTGAILLGVVGIGALLLARWVPLPLGLAALLVVSPIYIGARTSGAWTGDNLIVWLKTNFDPARAQSLEFRFTNENILIKRALEKPMLGWGDTGLARDVPRKRGEKAPITDGLWIIALGNLGYVGLASLYGAMLLPSLLFMLKYPPRRWSEPLIAPAAVIAMFFALWMIDNLLNAMINEVYILLAGGLASFAGAPRVQTAADEDGEMDEPEVDEKPDEPETPADAPPGVLVRRRR